MNRVFARSIALVLLAVSVLIAGTGAAEASAAYDTNRAQPDAAEIVSQTFAAYVLSQLRPSFLPENAPEVLRVKALVARLTQQLDDKTPWTVIVYDDGEGRFPAFAMPGHRIAVYAKVVNAVSDDSLGFTMAHEMGHVVLGHINARFAGMLEASRKDGKHLSAKDWATLIAYSPAVQTLEKQQELDADAFGARLSHKAGFNFVKGAKELFDLYGENPEDFSHPSESSRLDALSAIAKVF